MATTATGVRPKPKSGTKPTAEMRRLQQARQTALGFRPATGGHYTVFLQDLHQRFLLDWYMEIGCRSGRSFAPVRSKTIAVDPFFRTEINIIATKPALHVFQTTSDDFFAQGFLARNKIALSLCFIDGMHLFEYALRDFINTERQMNRDGIILLHDCCPATYKMTTRDLDNLPGAWTGDVWKIIPVLQKYRPDLTVTVLDCAPTGLVLVSGLDPDNDILQHNYDQILRDYQFLELETIGAKAFYASFVTTPVQGWMDGNRALLDKIALDPAQALRLRKHST